MDSVKRWLLSRPVHPAPAPAPSRPQFAVRAMPYAPDGLRFAVVSNRHIVVGWFATERQAHATLSVMVKH